MSDEAASVPPLRLLKVFWNSSGSDAALSPDLGPEPFF